MPSKDRTRDRFDASSHAYATSPVHASGKDLPILRDHLPETVDLLVDVSTGAGHTAHHLAPHVDRVLALDLAPRMAHLARKRLRDGGFPASGGVVADVDHLPLPTGSVDVVTNRIAAHHYPDLASAVTEMARVLRSGGVLLAVDNVPPADATVAAYLHELETLRDPTHETTRSEATWLDVLAAAGLEAQVVHRFRTRLEVTPWARRGGRTGEALDEVVARVRDAPPPVQDALQVQEDPLSFTLPKVMWLGEAPSG